jgi:hypothetical protein
MGNALQEWLDHITLLDVLGLVLWVVTVGGMLVTARRWIRPLVVRLRDMLDDWQGQPARPGVAARPGVMERLGKTSEQLSDHTRRLEVIEKTSRSADFHSRPNHGGSAYDDTRRQLEGMDGRLDRIERLLDFLKTDPKE